ncbi:MAG: N-acyl homoserine lactonase family protein [Burkholderiales bacterium]|nr:N-acyl homoserine lactonase family protein [Burkholderiales bacterium]HET8695665.1 N-acyl homoserine lactonase family protein [Aquabacterium sp.]
MTQVLKVWPLLTAMHRYDKSISTYRRHHGQMIEAPILAYLIETKQGRILYDVGCDYAKIHDPALRSVYYPPGSEFGAPDMREEHRIPHHLSRLGLTPADVDVIFIGHLHFDHAGGLKELKRCGCGAEIHVHHDEWQVASRGEDAVVFADDLLDEQGAPITMRLQHAEYDVVPGVRAINTPGHTAGHMSLWIERSQGSPIILAGDAADLQENLDEEIAPGTLWQEREDEALASIRKLKAIARETEAWIWPNHDLAFYRSLKPFPQGYE